MSEIKRYLLRTTALRRGEVFRVLVDGMLLTTQQRLDRALAEQARIQARLKRLNAEMPT
jgi:hypothetical protein